MDCVQGMMSNIKRCYKPVNLVFPMCSSCVLSFVYNLSLFMGCINSGYNYVNILTR